MREILVANQVIKVTNSSQTYGVRPLCQLPHRMPKMILQKQFEKIQQVPKIMYLERSAILVHRQQLVSTPNDLHLHLRHTTVRHGPSLYRLYENT